MNLLVLAGTEDGRRLAGELKTRGHRIWVSTLTEYGAQIAESQGLRTRHGALDEEKLLDLFKQNKIDGLIDATHPYAEKIHDLARRVSNTAGILYFRWERPKIVSEASPLVHWASGIVQAGEIACQLGQRIFLSTGSKNLKDWFGLPGFKEKEVFVRVLPSVEVLQQCEVLELKPYQIIAAQGPFTERFNEALWEQLQIDVVITKESGKTGGTEEKIKACLNLGIPVIVLERPGSEDSGQKSPQNLEKNSELSLPVDLVPEETMKEFLRRVEESI